MHSSPDVHTHTPSQRETWADELLIDYKSIVFLSVLCFVVLLQSSDYSPQQEALMKKQADTLEEIKALTNQVHTLTTGHLGGHCINFHFWRLSLSLTITPTFILSLTKRQVWTLMVDLAGAWFLSKFWKEFLSPNMINTRHINSIKLIYSAINKSLFFTYMVNCGLLSI